MQEIGTALTYGELGLSGVSRSFGTVDSRYLSLGRITLSDGRLPRKDGEVAVTQEVLEALEAACGSALSVGDKVPVPGRVQTSRASSRWKALCVCTTEAPTPRPSVSPLRGSRSGGRTFS